MKKCTTYSILLGLLALLTNDPFTLCVDSSSPSEKRLSPIKKLTATKSSLMFIALMTV